MSNKLYTEEQVKKAIRVTLGSSSIRTENDIISLLNHIELPSDEEIDKTAVEFAKKYRATTYEISAFIIGAKYIIDKIQGGNNE